MTDHRSPDELALLAAVTADPDNDLPRLVYADWLDDHDRPDRARLIRVQCQLGALKAEERDLLARGGDRWAEPLRRAGASGWEFRRGFPESIAIDSQRFLGSHNSLAAVTPVRSLRLTDASDPTLTQLAALPVLAQVRSLTVAGRGDDPARPFGQAGVRALATSPHLGGLERLHLHSPRVDAGVAALIAGGPAFGRLTHLSLDDGRAGSPVGMRGDRAVRRLAAALPRLEDLYVGGYRLTAADLAGWRPRPDRRPPTGQDNGRTR